MVRTELWLDTNYMKWTANRPDDFRYQSMSDHVKRDNLGGNAEKLVPVV